MFMHLRVAATQKTRIEYDLRIQQGSRGCRGTCSGKTPSSS